MTLEIRELVIEARVIDDRADSGSVPAVPGNTEEAMAHWMELVTRRVLDALNEQRERR